MHEKMLATIQAFTVIFYNQISIKINMQLISNLHLTRTKLAKRLSLVYSKLHEMNIFNQDTILLKLFCL